jgi:hypothetical protein
MCLRLAPNTAGAIFGLAYRLAASYVQAAEG